MAEIVPAAGKHMPVAIENESMSFAKRDLFDRLRVEDVFWYLLRERTHFTHVVTLKVRLR